jgi:4-hydroxy-tetrahydrodipicolinate synthase
MTTAQGSSANVSTKRPALAGVLPVFQTPLLEDDSIDAATLQKHIDWIYDQGAQGVVMAMVSETLRFSTDERRQLAELACAHGKARGSVIISVGAESTVVAQSLARHAQQHGAAAVMVIPPVATAAGEQQLAGYYRQIIEAIDIPVIVQDASGYVGKPMSIALQAGLLHDYGPSRVLFKPEATPIGPKLSQLRDATQGRARIFEGTGGLALVDSHRRGIAGTMPGGEIVWAIVALWTALENHDEKTIYRIWPVLTTLISLQTSLDAFLAIEKHLLVKQGIFKNTRVRGPVGYVLDDETRDEVDRLFEQLKLAMRGESS